MNASAARPLSISLQEYLTGEETSEVRHEYIDGEVYAMVGASDWHGLIVLNLGGALAGRLPESCQVFTSDMKVRIQTKAKEIFYYPDVLVSCAQDDRARHYREKPIVVVEVLSSSTARQDRFEKFSNYIEIPSLQEYVLIEQNFSMVEIFRRSRQWEDEVVRSGGFRLESVEMDFTLAEVYRRVSWASL
jgi:Uma2 family endonuclease